MKPEAKEKIKRILSEMLNEHEISDLVQRAVSCLDNRPHSCLRWDLRRDAKKCPSRDSAS